ncbi:MAG: DUF4139 domain-containing protein [Bacteroidota bacterium]
MRPFLLFLLLSISLFPLQALDSLELNSTLTEVTVFKQGAQLQRIANQRIPAGRSVLLFTSLSPRLDPNSIQLKASGDFTILSVAHQLDYFDPVVNSLELDTLEERRLLLQQLVQEEQVRLRIGGEEEAILMENRDFRGSDRGLDPEVLQANVAYHRERITSIRMTALEISRRIDSYQVEIQQLNGRIQQLSTQTGKYSTKAVIKIDNPRAQTVDFELSYLVADASWLPSYDIRVADVEQPIELIYRAKISQQTGEDWDSVKLTLSTGDPSRSAIAPELNEWRLYRYRPVRAQAGLRLEREEASGGPGNIRRVSGVITDRNGEPLVGASILIIGTTIGTVTDLDGHYQLNAPVGSNELMVSYSGFSSTTLPINGNQVNASLVGGERLDEVIVTGFASGGGGRNRNRRRADASPPPPARPAPVQTQRRTTTVVFKVDLPYSIPSSTETETVELSRNELPADYSYLAVPKLDERAYLRAAVTEWEQYDLLSGETQLFFEGTYLGRGFLDVENLSDTLNLSLGVDESIIIDRERNEDFSRGQFIGGKRRDSRGWTISVRNNKSRNVRLTVVDQVPISGDSDIDVRPELPENVRTEEDSGIFRWSFELAPSEQEELHFGYEVRYPKSIRVALE